MLDGIRLLAETEGLFAETAGGVVVASARRLAEAGAFADGEPVVLLITGHGLKTVEALPGHAPVRRRHRRQPRGLRSVLEPAWHGGLGAGASRARRDRAARRARPRGRDAVGAALEVWKLGGASIADASAVRRAAGLIQRHPGPLVVVVSALRGVTDALLDGAHRSATGDVAAASAQAAAFLRRHRALVLDLVPARARPPPPPRRGRPRGARVPRDLPRGGRPRPPLSPDERRPRVARGAGGGVDHRGDGFGGRTSGREGGRARRGVDGRPPRRGGAGSGRDAPARTQGASMRALTS